MAARVALANRRDGDGQRRTSGHRKRSRGAGNQAAAIESAGRCAPLGLCGMHGERVSVLRRRVAGAGHDQATVGVLCGGVGGFVGGFGLARAA